LTISISYQTLQAPPPYAMAFTLNVDLSDKVLVEINIEYLDREEIDEMEIEAEGFTLDDNFNWKGTIGDSWSKSIKNYFDGVKVNRHSKDIQHWLYGKVINNNATKEGHLNDPENQLPFLQQIIQACFEKSQRELPLQLKLKLIESGSKEQLSINASFEQRTFKINDSLSPWENLETFMSLLYNHETDNSKPQKIPESEGVWVDFNNENLFYKLNNPSKEFIQTLNRLLK